MFILLHYLTLYSQGLLEFFHNQPYCLDKDIDEDKNTLEIQTLLVASHY